MEKFASGVNESMPILQMRCILIITNADDCVNDYFLCRSVRFDKFCVIDKHCTIHYTHVVVSTPLSLNFIVNTNKRRTMWAISTQVSCAHLICVAPLVLLLLATTLACERRALLCYHYNRSLSFGH